LRNCESYFFDFQENLFPAQAKFLYDEVGIAVKHGKISTAKKMLNEIYFKGEGGDKNKNLVKHFPNNSKEWKIVQARCIYLTDVPLELSDSFAQITMQYKNDENKIQYVVFERPITQNISCLSWKIFILNYENFNK
jgi:hypothetical protein